MLLSGEPGRENNCWFFLTKGKGAPILRGAMIKNAFLRSVLVAACAFSLVCCGGGGGGGGSAKKGIDAGNLIPEEASKFKLEGGFLGFEIDFYCDNVTFIHTGHEGSECPGDCSGTLSSTSTLTIKASDSNDMEKTRTYSGVSGKWSVSFNGDYYILSFSELRENSKHIDIGSVTVYFRASGVEEDGVVRRVDGEIVGGQAAIAGYSGGLGGLAWIITEPSTIKTEPSK